MCGWGETHQLKRGYWSKKNVAELTEFEIAGGAVGPKSSAVLDRQVPPYFVQRARVEPDGILELALLEKLIALLPESSGNLCSSQKVSSVIPSAKLSPRERAAPPEGSPS